MSNGNLRNQVNINVANRSSTINYEAEARQLESFGVNLFNDKVMRDKLAKDVYEKLKETIQRGASLDMNIANSVAHALKEWAKENGVTHYTHWFQPLTGSTAEKHDSFLEIDDGIPIERFRAKQLVQGEPDASSFPHGGRRTTFEARGYTAWDPSSPAFIKEGPKGGILCIPSVFISYNGDALDKKTPLLRAMEDLNESAQRILDIFGKEDVDRVKTTIGTEQEYFLIDKEYYAMRPDLQLTGRTLIGADAPKGQELDDHYFGAIKERVLEFMQEVEEELYKLGIPAKTRHNEVAPQQFEIAPIFAEANLGADRNQLMMQTIKEVANRNGLAALLHEKPFAGINGSGKHNNWSIEDSEGNNLLDPGETPEENLQFLVFLISTLKAVYRHGDLLRATVASSSNDHRLGGNEAPPAIMSVFLGEHLDSILNHIKEGKDFDSSEDFVIDLGIDQLPSILKDNTDRNRTSPFAFTGNKFEFRAPGSDASVSFTNTVLSAAVSDALEEIAYDIKNELNQKDNFDQAVLKVLQKHIEETEDIRFEGDNYSDEWVEEAEERGLPNLETSGYAYDVLLDDDNKDMLTRRDILNEKEIESIYNTKQERYITELEIECETMKDLVKTKILPSAIEYQTELAQDVKETKAIEDAVDIEMNLDSKEMLKEVNTLIAEVRNNLKTLDQKLEESEEKSSLSDMAKYFSDEIVPQLEDLRAPVDKLEKVLPDELWQLPKYYEMLFSL